MFWGEKEVKEKLKGNTEKGLSESRDYDSSRGMICARRWQCLLFISGRSARGGVGQSQLAQKFCKTKYYLNDLSP